MKTRLSLIAVFVAFVLAGCGAGTQQLDPATVSANAEQNGKVRYELQQKAKGDWNALSPADRATYVKTFEGDEAKAKTFWDNVKNGPPGSRGMAGGGRPAGG